MIDLDEIRAQSAVWGIAESQIRKDHLVSHLLRALDGLRGFVFFGGTALNRTYLDNCRLSEDIDLFLMHSAPADTEAITAALLKATRREFPDLVIEAVGLSGDVRTYIVTTEDLITQLQIVGPRQEDSRYPTAVKGVALRYSDLPEKVMLRVPTQDSFVAMKCAAYEDRKLPRDLFDLGALAERGAIGSSAVETLRGFRGSGPTRWAYEDSRCPSPTQWDTELAHQTKNVGDPLETLGRVRAALSLACGWGG